jgi:hypothetical protein
VKSVLNEIGTPVIADAVFTTGSHLRVAGAKIANANTSVPALCAIRITRVPIDAPFRPQAETIPDFYPVPRESAVLRPAEASIGRITASDSAI